MPVIAGLWATYIKQIPELVTSGNQTMKAGRKTTCRMSFEEENEFDGTSTSGYHGEIDCLNQAEEAELDLSTGEFVSLSNPVCLVCATVLYAVGITTVPAIATGSKEYANYKLPGWLWDEDQEYLEDLLGELAFNAWTNHVSPATRQKSEVRQQLVTAMTQVLRKS
ncbi:hypothetical protein [Actinoallomurus sp. CA-142502]|uniref:hypothetical protein n=1 Tax=Actinoallomurus sp. CA-142502 TaxID=3239885 RepID=UPI003D8FC977